MKVLLIEDEENTARMIQSILSSENVICDVTESGEEALEIGRVYDYDVIILDLNLPDINGHDVLRKFREASISTPVLILSGIQDIQEKVRALGFGADDYVTKPFNREELIVRLKALSRRAEGHASSVICVGPLELKLSSQTITANKIPLCLTGKEYQILEFLMLRKGATITKEGFLNRLYNGMDEPEAKIIDVFMCKIRKKLEEALGEIGRHFIETIWGRGYVLREPILAEDEVEKTSASFVSVDNALSIATPFASENSADSHHPAVVNAASVQRLST